MNHQIEYQIVGQLKKDLESKDEVCRKTINEVQDKMMKVQENCDKRMQQLVEGFRTDMSIVDKEVNK